MPLEVVHSTNSQKITAAVAQFRLFEAVGIIFLKVTRFIIREDAPVGFIICGLDSSL